MHKYLQVILKVYHLIGY